MTEKRNYYKGFYKSKSGSKWAFIDGKWEKGEWIVGNLLLLDDAEDDYSAIIIPRVGSECLSNKSEKYIKFEHWYKVARSSVCQCTGITDKNDCLIFENDIIRYRDNIKTMGLTTHTSAVEWNAEIGGFVIHADGIGYYHINPAQSKLYEMEVIGTMFDITKQVEPLLPKWSLFTGFQCPHCGKKLKNRKPDDYSSPEIHPCEHCGADVYWTPTKNASNIKD